MTTGNSSIDSGYSSLIATPVIVDESLPLERVPAAEPVSRRVSKPATGFHPRTVRILETWYSANLRHPYPTDEILDQLASDGGITVKQARKWLANRRVRSFNTLTYNGAVHPKRLRSLQRRTNCLPQMQQPRAAAICRGVSDSSSSSDDERALMNGPPTIVNSTSMSWSTFDFFRSRMSSMSVGSQFPATSLVDCRQFETPGGSISVRHQITPEVACAQSAVASVRPGDEFVASSTGIQSVWTPTAASSAFLGHWSVLPRQVAPSSNISDQGCFEDVTHW
jgi:hypothetical protein